MLKGGGTGGEQSSKEQGLFEYVFARAGNLFVSSLADISETISGGFEGGNYPCVSLWLLLILALYSLMKGIKNKGEKRNRYMWLIWALSLIFFAAYLYLWVGSCVNMFILAVWVTTTLLIRWYTFEKKEEDSRQSSARLEDLRFEKTRF